MTCKRGIAFVFSAAILGSMKMFIVLLLGVGIGVGAYWFLTDRDRKDDLQQVRNEVTEGAEKVKDSVKKAVNEIDTESIKDELAKTGTVIREKAKKAGNAIAEATVDARITAAIKTKLATEPGVSALKINIDTTDGLVTLSGTSNSYEEVAKAVKIALDTDGVRKVVSTIQVTSAR